MADGVFPLEIVHHIIGLAAKEDDNKFSTTKSCALVCYGLFGFCRQLMFEAVEVDGTYSDAAGWDHPTLRLSSAGFIKALSGDSGLRLGSTIQKLSFVISRADLVNPAALQQALKTINQLEYLMVTQVVSVTPFQIRELAVIRNTFKHLFELPTLSAICISDFPVFSVGSGLKAITVWASRPQTRDKYFKFPTAFSENRAELESITFHGYAAPALKELLSYTRANGTPVVGVDNLKRLVVHSLTFESLAEFRSLASSSLDGLEEAAFMAQELEVNFSYRGDERIYTAIAPSLKTLKRLTLGLPFADHDCDAFLSDFGQQLDLIRKSVNCIEEIFISISTRKYKPPLSEGGYYLLDRIFSDKGWSHLQHVSLTFTSGRHVGGEPISVDSLRKRLGRLTAIKKIKVTLECLDEW